MTSNLLGRSLGIISPRGFQRTETSRLLHALQAAPGVRFDGSDESVQAHRTGGEEDGQAEPAWAHRAGVNCITIDRFEGRYMLSGGADSGVNLWDLESAENTTKHLIYTPAVRTDRASSAHKFGITHLSFYPFDSLAYLSTSYDHSLKVCSTETLAPSASFDLGSVAYSHSVSPIADHLLVACAMQHPAIRLVDLRTAASAHSLAGHQGAVLSVSWSPSDEYLLASGGSDGTVRLWDIRRSAGSLGVLDMEDSVGIGGEDGMGKNTRPRHRGTAHVGACNGVVWTGDGRFLVTAGHDERVRVWDVSVGANALSHFGPIIKNRHLSTLLPLLVPSNIGEGREQIMLFPNEKDILMLHLFEGTLHKRLRFAGAAVAQAGGGIGQRNIKNRITCLAWRAGNVEMFSAHSDGVIRTWKPQTLAEADIEQQEVEAVDNDEDEGRKRKRQALDEVFRDLTRQKITFT
ncbi:hypothetical protein MMC21_004089 [Puttea exsequens]|nr:hypothetical protein [Puttea exsequens]